MIAADGTELYIGGQLVASVTDISGMEKSFEQRDRTSLVSQTDESENGTPQLAEVELTLLMTQDDFERLEALQASGAQALLEIGHSDGTAAPPSTARTWAKFTGRIGAIAWGYQMREMVQLTATVHATSIIEVIWK